AEAPRLQQDRFADPRGVARAAGADWRTRAVVDLRVDTDRGRARAAPSRPGRRAPGTTSTHPDQTFAIRREAARGDSPRGRGRGAANGGRSVVRRGTGGRSAGRPAAARGRRGDEREGAAVGGDGRSRLRHSPYEKARLGDIQGALGNSKVMVAQGLEPRTSGM